MVPQCYVCCWLNFVSSAGVPHAAAPVGATACLPACLQVFKLFTDARSKAGSKQSITAFFKPAGAAAARGKAAGSAAKSK